jgi:hypothetical protein
MIKTETREYVKSLVMDAQQGISLSELHGKMHRTLTRLQLRTTLDTLYVKGTISRERITELSRRETRYYPFNGKEPMKRKNTQARENESDILSMKDFMPGRKYAAYIDF